MLGVFHLTPNETNNRKAGFYNICEENKIAVKVLDMPEPISNLEEQLLAFFRIILKLIAFLPSMISWLWM